MELRRFELRSMGCKPIVIANYTIAPFCAVTRTRTENLLVGSQALYIGATTAFERMKGVEPSSEHWKCPVIAVIRHPLVVGEMGIEPTISCV